MGRKKLNRTADELRAMRRARQKRFYQKHKDRLNEESMQRYWKKKMQ